MHLHCIIWFLLFCLFLFVGACLGMFGELKSAGLYDSESKWSAQGRVFVARSVMKHAVLLGSLRTIHPFFREQTRFFFFSRLILQLAIVMNAHEKIYYEYIQQLNLYKCARSLTRTASSASSRVHREGLSLSLPSVKCYK